MPVLSREVDAVVLTESDVSLGLGPGLGLAIIGAGWDTPPEMVFKLDDITVEGIVESGAVTVDPPDDMGSADGV